MATTRLLALRQAFAAIVMVVLTLSGVGRAMALADGPQHRLVEIAGVAIEICHTETGDTSLPGDPRHHDCCDDCALCTPIACPEPSRFVAPKRVEHFADHAAALTWAPRVARIPTPRSSQGPPAA